MLCGSYKHEKLRKKNHHNRGKSSNKEKKELDVRQVLYKNIYNDFQRKLHSAFITLSISKLISWELYK